MLNKMKNVFLLAAILNSNIAICNNFTEPTTPTQPYENVMEVEAFEPKEETCCCVKRSTAQLTFGLLSAASLATGIIMWSGLDHEQIANGTQEDNSPYRAFLIGGALGLGFTFASCCKKTASGNYSIEN